MQNGVGSRINRIYYAGYNLALAVKVWAKIGSRIIGKEYKVDKDNRRMVEYMVKYIQGDTAFSGDLHKGILICGPTGTGKTLLFQIMREYCEIDNVRYDYMGKMRRLRPMIEDSAEIVEAYSVSGDDGVQMFRNYNSLMIDDIGKERREAVYFGNRVDVMRELLDYRYRNNLLTFGTSNFALNDIADKYGDVIESRVHAMFNIVELTGNDRRKV